MRAFFTLVFALAAAACGGTVVTGTGGAGGESGTSTSTTTGATSTTGTSTGTGTSTCTQGVYVEPGCGDPPPSYIVPEAGCYQPCTTLGAPCVSGGGCEQAWTNPCICTDPSGPCCGACGGEQLLCIK